MGSSQVWKEPSKLAISLHFLFGHPVSNATKIVSQTLLSHFLTLPPPTPLSFFSQRKRPG